MLTASIVLCLAVVSFAQVPGYNETCVKGTYPPDIKYKVPTYKVNLDLPPEQRWAEVVKDKGPKIKALLDDVKRLVREFSPTFQKGIDFVDQNLGKLDETLPYPFADEIRGIAEASKLNLGEILLFNIFYEVFTVCTSVVAEDSTGKLYHARNLDFGLFMGWDVANNTWMTTEYLRPLIVNIEYTRGGQTLFKAVHYAGYVGILTAVKPKLFTFSMDERFNLRGGFIGIIEWIMGDHSGTWMGFLTRQVMENATSYSQASKWLQETKMLAPAYFILGGNRSGEGAVITRSQTESLQFWQMTDPDADKWFILETNYDHWQKPMVLDDRRTPAKKCMNKLSQKGVSFDGIFDVLSSKPVLNKLTTYTALMQVDSGHLETWLQYCKDPCFPW